MTKTLIDLDEQLLDRALRLSGLPTKKAVVTLALESLVHRLELARYADFATSGALGDLTDPDVVRGAQR